MCRVNFFYFTLLKTDLSYYGSCMGFDFWLRRKRRRDAVLQETVRKWTFNTFTVSALFSFSLSSSHTCSCSSCSGLQLTRPPKRTRCPASLPPCVSLLSSAWRWHPERSVLTVLSFPWLFRPGCYIGPLGVSKSVSGSWWCFLAALAPPTAPTQLLFGWARRGGGISPHDWLLWSTERQDDTCWSWWITCLQENLLCSGRWPEEDRRFTRLCPDTQDAPSERCNKTHLKDNFDILCFWVKPKLNV